MKTTFLYLFFLIETAVTIGQQKEIKLQQVDITPKNKTTAADTIPEIEKQIRALRQKADWLIKIQSDSIINEAGILIRRITDSIKLVTERSIQNLSQTNKDVAVKSPPADKTTIIQDSSVQPQPEKRAEDAMVEEIKDQPNHERVVADTAKNSTINPVNSATPVASQDSTKQLAGNPVVPEVLKDSIKQSLNTEPPQEMKPVTEAKIDSIPKPLPTQPSSPDTTLLINQPNATAAVRPFGTSENILVNSKDVSLAGYFHKPLIPKKERYPLIVVLHSSNDGSHDNRLYWQLVDDMNKIGYAVFTYDRRGSGNSQGNAGADFNELANDASAAIDKLKRRDDVDTSKIGLYGINQGAWIAGILNSMRNDITFNIMVSSSTMTLADQMNFAAFTQLQKKGYTRLEIDSAIRVRSVVDDYYRGRLTYEQALPFVQRDTASRWYRDAMIVELTQPKEKSVWFKQMDFDPTSYFKSITKPTLVIYGDQDQWVSVDKGIYDWKQYNLPKLETKRVNLTGHFMVEFENDNPKNPVTSGMYRNVLESWVKKR